MAMTASWAKMGMGRAKLQSLSAVSSCYSCMCCFGVCWHHRTASWGLQAALLQTRGASVCAFPGVEGLWASAQQGSGGRLQLLSLPGFSPGALGFSLHTSAPGSSGRLWTSAQGHRAPALGFSPGAPAWKNCQSSHQKKPNKTVKRTPALDLPLYICSFPDVPYFFKMSALNKCIKKEGYIMICPLTLSSLFCNCTEATSSL